MNVEREELNLLANQCCSGSGGVDVELRGGAGDCELFDLVVMKQNRPGHDLLHVRGGEGDGRKTVIADQSDQSILLGAAEALSSSRSRGVGTSRVPITGNGSSEKKPSSCGSLTTGGAGCGSSRRESFELR